MRHLLFVLAAVLTLQSICQEASADDRSLPPILARLQGRWKATKWVIHGEEVTEGRDNRSYRIDGRKITFFTDGKYVGTGQLKLNTRTVPHEIDVTYHGGPRDGQTLLGIFKVEDGKLVNCFSYPGTPRPTTFEPTAENRYFLAIETRVKD